MTSPTEPEASASAVIRVADEPALGRLATRLAATLGPRVVVALSGDLGAGKTTFVKALAAAVGIDAAEVTSPTFGLIHVHQPPAAAGRPERIVHADMYRLADSRELAETGWDDAIAGAGWVFVEWPERVAAALPAERLDLGIGIDSPSARTLTFRGRGAEAAAIVRGLNAGASNAANAGNTAGAG
jgi:tRNA threonylcarbamoyl adenosine modification protein YjeE